MPTKQGMEKENYNGKYTAKVLRELRKMRGDRSHTVSDLHKAVLGKRLKSGNIKDRTAFDRSRREAYEILGKDLGGKWSVTRGTGGRYAEWSFRGKAAKTATRRQTKRPGREQARRRAHNTANQLAVAAFA